MRFACIAKHRHIWPISWLCEVLEASRSAFHILARDFEEDRPNQKWLADFADIWTAQGWLYVAVVLDLFSRRVVGWSMKAERDATLVMDALMMAVCRRGKADAFLHHSDQGWQYTSEQFQRLLADIERFYNPRRRHAKLGYHSPMEFEARDMLGFQQRFEALISRTFPAE